MTAEEIIDILTDELDLSTYGFIYNKFDKDELHKLLGPYELEDENGGYEGGGEYAERIYHFTDHKVFIRIIGFYSSGNGTDWENEFEEVFPRKTVVTVFESVDERGDQVDEV